MKKFIFVIENQKPVCFYVEPEMIPRLRNKYCGIYNTKGDCINAINSKITEIKARHISDEERKRIEKEQLMYARSKFTDEDWKIVKEIREQRKSIEQQQLEYAREMMRKERSYDL